MPATRRWWWLLAVALVAAGDGMARAAPPNVLLIVSDDQHWRDYGFMGHPHLRTPHLDRLARESLVFRRGYVPSSLCCPSLASLITGRFPHEHRIVGNDPPGARGAAGRDQEAFVAGRERMSRHLEAWPTLPALLGARGYASLQTGKWWQGDWKRGGFTAGMTRGDRHGDDGLAIGRRTLEPIETFIRGCRDESRPFFVWYAPMLPHDPHDPDPAVATAYEAAAESPHVARYWGNVERFDATVGRLLDFLDAERLAADTLVVYVTDNGWIQDPERPRYAARSKRSPYDGGLRTPIMVRWPGRIEPRTCDDLASSLDILPTVAAACGAPLPPDLPGIDLLDAAAREARHDLHGACFTHTIVDLDDPARSLLWRWMVRDTWKLVVPATAGGAAAPPWDGGVDDPEARARYEQGTVELYDLVADPDERENLAAAHGDVVAEMERALDGWWDPRGQAAAAPRKTNLLVFLADDLGAHDLGCTGSSFHRSPTIDRLAATGMRFTRGYAACPVCSPTRAALLTGRHPARVGITNFIAGDRRGALLPAPFLHALPEAEVTIAERLRVAGYTTGVFGKWHLGPGNQTDRHGFDVAALTEVGPGSGPVDDPLHARGIAAAAAAFIDAAGERPWFCYVPMHSVHVPLVTRPELAAEEGRRAVGVGPRFPAVAAPAGDPVTRTVQDHPVYAGMIREMDETVAAVLEAVERSGQADHTLVVFTSDNGGLATAEGAPTSNLPLRAGKGFVYEGGVRVPLIVRWPTVGAAGSTSDAPVSTLDVAATLLDAAGIGSVVGLDGASLRPVVGGGRWEPRDLVWHYPHYSNQGGRPAGALVAGDGAVPGGEKLVERFEDGGLELYDLAADPGERHDLAAERPQRARELAARLAAWRDSSGARLPEPNPDPVDPFSPRAIPPRASPR